jgi:hypothetical protein
VEIKKKLLSDKEKGQPRYFTLLSSVPRPPFPSAPPPSTANPFHPRRAYVSGQKRRTLPPGARLLCVCAGTASSSFPDEPSSARFSKSPRRPGDPASLPPYRRQQLRRGRARALESPCCSLLSSGRILCLLRRSCSSARAPGPPHPLPSLESSRLLRVLLHPVPCCGRPGCDSQPTYLTSWRGAV